MAQFTFKNTRTHLVTVWVEPWARDYSMQPGESLELSVAGASNARSPLFQFSVEFADDDLLVYIEGDVDDVIAKSKGVILGCGHQRAMRPEHNSHFDDDNCPDQIAIPTEN